MAGPAATPGVFILFNSCSEHNPEGKEVLEKWFVDSNVLPMSTFAKCAHVHCMECGCMKSRTECVYKEPDRISVSGTKIPASWATKEESAIYDYTKVEKTGPERVHFNIEWTYEGNNFFCSGNLPTEIATKVIEAVNTPY